MMTVYESDIVLGAEYADTHTGLTGRATAIYFFDYACERVRLEWLHDGQVRSDTFDAPRLTELDTVPGEHGNVHVPGLRRGRMPGGPSREGDTRPADGSRP